MYQVYTKVPGCRSCLGVQLLSLVFVMIWHNDDGLSSGMTPLYKLQCLVGCLERKRLVNHRMDLTETIQEQLQKIIRKSNKNTRKQGRIMRKCYQTITFKTVSSIFTMRLILCRYVKTKFSNGHAIALDPWLHQEQNWKYVRKVEYVQHIK